MGTGTGVRLIELFCYDTALSMSAGDKQAWELRNLDDNAEGGMSALKSSAHRRSPVSACRRSGENAWKQEKSGYVIVSHAPKRT